MGNWNLRFQHPLAMSGTVSLYRAGIRASFRQSGSWLVDRVLSVIAFTAAVSNKQINHRQTLRH